MEASSKFLRAQLQPGAVELLADGTEAHYRTELRRRRKASRQARKHAQRVARRSK